jgi:uncharacterized protein YgiM (DUF1202 family)
MVIILAYMNANKPPSVLTDAAPYEEEKTTEREILFNVAPLPDNEGTYIPDDFPDGEEDEEDDDPDITRLNQIMYAVSAVNLRAGPGTDFERVGSLAANQKVRAIGQSIATQWYKVEHGDGFAFVSGSYLALADDEPFAETQDVYEPNPEEFED